MRRRGNSQSSRVKEVRTREKTIEEFVQEFRRAARESRYEERPLIEEFK